MSDQDQNAPIISYKGFDEQLKCRDFQYEIGKTYTHEGEVKACGGGFHACEFPLHVFSYYPVHNSRFAIVEQSGKLSRDGSDTKIASQQLTIKTEINIAGLVKAAVEWARAKATATSGDGAHSATSGDGAHSATSGDGANSATSGYGAHSATSGDGANSATSGNGAHSATSGKYANSATSGYGAHSATSAVGGVAANAGSGTAQAAEGGAIFLVERDSAMNILHVFASKVGENGIKAGVKYRLSNGAAVEFA